MKKNGAEIRIGVAACLLGERVRHDGGHKRDALVADLLARFVDLVPVCPELEIGLGVPRETLRLVRTSEEVRMVAPASGKDHTDAMRRYAARRVRQLERLDLSGYILKKSSPSCGMERVRTFTPRGRPAPSGRGLFAETLMKMLPLLPVEEEGRLHDAELRERFLLRVFAYHHLQRLGDGKTRRFHDAVEDFLRGSERQLLRRRARSRSGA